MNRSRKIVTLDNFRQRKPASGPAGDREMSAIIDQLDHLRTMAQDRHHDVMASHIQRAFESCLALYVGQKEAELEARIRATAHKPA